MPIEWKDATSYSRGRRGKVPQSAWEARVEGVRLYVTCRHLYFPGRWIVTSRELGLTTFVLGEADAISADEACALAVEKAKSTAREIADRMNSFIGAAAHLSRPQQQGR